ncbi:MAG: hypothetical protein IJQ14_07105 [Bacteroidales bacterium]|nr:hypothetical protein [Bacteroidales bacterium]
MYHAQGKSVAWHPLPDMLSVAGMQVYVTVLDGQALVFTKLIRWADVNFSLFQPPQACACGGFVSPLFSRCSVVVQSLFSQTLNND